MATIIPAIQYLEVYYHKPYWAKGVDVLKFNITTLAECGTCCQGEEGFGDGDHPQHHARVCECGEAEV